mgnify:CR=1 FL=1
MHTPLPPDALSQCVQALSLGKGGSALAKLAKCSRQTVVRYMSGESPVPPSVRELLVKELAKAAKRIRLAELALGVAPTKLDAQGNKKPPRMPKPVRAYYELLRGYIDSQIAKKEFFKRSQFVKLWENSEYGRDLEHDHLTDAEVWLYKNGYVSGSFSNQASEHADVGEGQEPGAVPIYGPNWPLTPAWRQFDY